MCKTSLKPPPPPSSGAKEDPSGSRFVESCRPLLRPNGGIVGSDIARVVLPRYGTLLSAVPDAVAPAHPALASIDGRVPMTHAAVRDFVTDLGRRLHRLGVGRGHRVAVILPNGPELALAILAVSHWASCVPLNANGAATELEADCRRCRADVILGPCAGGGAARSEEEEEEEAPVDAGDLPAALREAAQRFHVLPSGASSSRGVAFAGFAHVPELAARLRIPYCGLAPSAAVAGTFRLVPRSVPLIPYRLETVNMVGPTASDRSDEPSETSGLLSTSSSASGTRSSDAGGAKDEYVVRFTPNGHEDEALVLFTSGTTGNKKLVPHRVDDILVAAATIALSWDLSPSDVNCNVMPLFHVGGIIRQVFSPILSGGCVICCPSFDPNLFWSLLRQRAFNWYYAAPTIHMVIISCGKDHTNNEELCLADLIKPRLRMIANAAGGLLPSLAEELRDMFGAHVLPSYGMTECMPISSPPSNYQLEKPGSSGVPVGPEVAIMEASSTKMLPPRIEGRICVRGEPCFRGYGINHLEPSANAASSFLAHGWFATGDLGYFDEDGFLYITGRSKEVINRGGEIISPLEVEEAVAAHPRVQACAAFSAEHPVLQEVVGIAIVANSNKPKIGLNDLHNFLADRLENSKWPQCIVFLERLPKSHTNKVLRVNLAKRLRLPAILDDMSSVERIFEATCPKDGESLETEIQCRPATISLPFVETTLRDALVERKEQKLFLACHPSRAGSLVAYVYKIDRKQLIEVAMSLLDGYAVPSHVCSMTSSTLAVENLPHPKPNDSVISILQSAADGTGGSDPVESQVTTILMDLLKLDYISSTSNFFKVGGSSMLASQLASKIRRSFEISFIGTEIFQNNSIAAITKCVKERLSKAKSNKSPLSPAPVRQGVVFKTDRLEPEKSLPKTLFQLIPLCLVLPVWQLSRFFFYFMLLLQMLKGVPLAAEFVSRFNEIKFDYFMTALVLALVSFHLLWVTVTPLLFVILKWVVIGKYRQGHYPIWSWYYLRWWFVDVVRKLVGRGVWGSSEALLAFYYRLLGASIGPGARISIDAEIAEFDLVTIGADAAIEYATLRPFGVDNGSMMLGPIKVGHRSSVGMRSVVAPFTTIPDDTDLGPVTSSYEVKSCSDPKHRKYNRYALPAPSSFSQLFVGWPIVLLVNALSHVPGCFVLYLLVTMPFHYDISEGNLSDLMEWLCDVRRIPFYIGIRIVRSLVAPFVKLAAAVLVKRLLIGKFKAGPRDTSSEWQLLRHWLVSTLFSRQNIQEVTDIIGRHYELVSILYRLLGARVGKRVFWPGHQPIFSGEFDLLEIGDDVVFGSRAAIICTTSKACERVILCAGSNLSDNSIVLPGSILGKNSVLGSNSVCPAGWYLPEQSTWCGVQNGEPVLLRKGDDADLDSPMLARDRMEIELQHHGDASTLRPFGRAFYQKQTPYKIFSLFFIILFSIGCRIFIVAFHTFPILAALHATAAIIYGWSPSERDYERIVISAPRFYFTLLSVMVVTNLIRVGFWIGIEVAAKWGLMGRRQEGQYDYDRSDYCQRWELYQLASKVRNFGRMNLMEFLAGTPYMVWYFRLLGSRIGRDCCLYPAGGDPYMPEPDLVEMGDGCVVDMASIVCHLNTGGHFELRRIVLQNHATLRARSRVQQGVVMEVGSMLLEKSLALTGEVCDAYSVWQGAPASRVYSYDRAAYGSDNYGSFSTSEHLPLLPEDRA